MEAPDWPVTTKWRNLCRRSYMLTNDTLSFGVDGNCGLFIHSPKLTYLVVTRMFVIR